MKKVAFTILASAALLAFTPAYAGSFPATYSEGEADPTPSTDGPSNGCGEGFHLDGILCVPN